MMKKARSGETIFHKTCRLISILLLALLVIFLILRWGKLPGHMPIHFNKKGLPDRYGAKWTVLIFPFIAAFLFAFLEGIGWLIRKVQRQEEKNEHLDTAYRVIRDMIAVIELECMAAFCYISYCVVAMTNIAWCFFPIFLIVFFISILLPSIKAVQVKKTLEL